MTFVAWCESGERLAVGSLLQGEGVPEGTKVSDKEVVTKSETLVVVETADGQKFSAKIYTRGNGQNGFFRSM